MKATQLLHDLGQSLWLDNITRDLLDNGTLQRYIDELSVTGLTSNPTIFDQAIKHSTAYDTAIRQKLTEGQSGEALFFELALEDLTRAADLFRPIYDRTDGVDGWVSLEVSPLLAYDAASTVVAGEVERGVAICGSGVGAAVYANKVAGIRAAIIHDHFSARQGVEDDHLNIICMGGRTVGPAVAWDLVQTFLAAECSQAERHLRRLSKVAALEAGSQ